MKPEGAPDILDESALSRAARKAEPNCDDMTAMKLERAMAGGITRREREILELIVAGMSNRRIAGVLGISIKTVSHHRASIMEKLDVRNTASLVRQAIKSGLVTV